MAAFDLDTYLELLRQELPDMPVLAMPSVRHVGLMRCSLTARDADAARHALARLLTSPAGGILVAPVAAGGVATDPQRVLRALRALVDEEAAGSLTEAQVVDLLDGPAVCLHLDSACVQDEPGVPAESEPVEEAGVYDLDTRPLAGLGLPRDGMEIGGGSAWLTPIETLLVRQGAAVVQDGLVVPTVAGLVALGTSPARWLPGMRVRLESGRGAWISGSLREVAAGVAQHPVLRPFPALVVKELVLNAIVHRDWAAREVPVRVRVVGCRLEVVSPGPLGCPEAPPNPRLRALVRQLGLADGRGRGLAAVNDELRARSWPALDLVEVDAEVWASVEARPARTKAPPVRPVAVATRPRSVAVAQARPHPRERPAPLPPRPVVVPAPPVPEPVPRPENPVRDAASIRDEAVMDLLRERGTLTTREVQEALGWSRSSTRDTLARLVEAGTLERLADSPRSPRQGYKLPA